MSRVTVLILNHANCIVFRRSLSKLSVDEECSNFFAALAAVEAAHGVIYRGNQSIVRTQDILKQLHIALGILPTFHKICILSYELQPESALKSFFATVAKELARVLQNPFVGSSDTIDDKEFANVVTKAAHERIGKA